MVLMLFSGSACWLNPAKHTLIAVLGLLFPVFFLINIGFVAWWAICRKRLFLMSLIAVLPFVHRYVDLPSSSDNGAVSRNTIRILSYNTHNFGLSAWPRHIDAMNEMLEFVGCENLDIVCLQEYTNGIKDLPSDAGLRKIFKYGHLHYSIETWNRGDTRTGLATYTNYPIVGEGDIMSDNETSNAIIYTDIKIGADTIRVFNCHLQSNKFSDEEYRFIEKVNSFDADVYDKSKINENKKGLGDVYRRMKKAYVWRVTQANTLARCANESPYPAVICGDFNETQSSYIYRLVSKGRKDSQRLTSTGWRNTYRRFVPGIRIDYILYDSPLKCINCKVPQVDYSDHRPVVGEYVIVR